MLDFLQGQVIQLKGSILGFENCNAFSISVVEENRHFAHLQSMEQGDIGFLVVSPFTFYPEYWLEIEEKDNKQLDIQSHEDVVVLSIVTTGKTFSESTMNLLAPIILNISNGRGKQIVLPPKSKYGTKEPLFIAARKENGA
ncbi:flagellar assembly factor FliW [Paenibacillus baekrokdamisoli]|uniref:Flagellar assembly factor FliW n=1 Tax=Paenibacillus baekrokdamisoli TaxID=1712516 RepID=A0A3G9IYC3_9BACL|nr:flagellar assembly protein FliW [Paenibacillus baekrokdamisoli]MBB3069093.1 flagellar assembly factor FliW [Paenibacillus baekrokdamisoli]BBH23907.1 flagellar assembly factor FliW [Paenibacillus baekrokdamisoli]